ncbi:MAG: MFS transporter [Hyphomonadaceae bacterium]
MSDVAPLKAPPQPATRIGPRQAWFLLLCFLMMTSNFIDRTIVAILAAPLKAEFALSDLEVGLLGGFAFAMFYVTLGVPIARLAERANRVRIVSGAIALWSVTTALCGLAASYGQLLALRVGVSVGEAGASPPSLSLISDYFPPARRGFATAMHALGMPAGTFLGAIIGGAAAEAWGWRSAFFVVGAPGLLLAALFLLTVREPARGALDPPAVAAAADAPPPPLLEATRTLFRRRSYTHILVATTLANVVLQSVSAFQALYFLRRFDLSLSQAGLIVGLVGGAAAVIGTVAGGALSDWGARADRRWPLWISAAGVLAAAPLLPLALAQGEWRAAAAILAPATAAALLFLAPSVASVQNLAEPRLRATAAAYSAFVTAIVGMGAGPAFTGWLSDLFAARAFAGGEAYLTACASGGALAPGCAAAGVAGLQQALGVLAIFLIWSALHFLRAAQFHRADLDAVGAVTDR